MGSVLGYTDPTADDHVGVSRPTANGTAKIGNSTAASYSKTHFCDQKELQAKAAVDNGEERFVTNYPDSTSASSDSKPHHRDQGPPITKDADKEAEAAPGCDSKAAGSQNPQTASERESTSESPNTTKQSNPKNPSPSSRYSNSDSSSLENLDTPKRFHTTMSYSMTDFWTCRVGDTPFTMQRRYRDPVSIGSGAQGVVM